MIVFDERSEFDNGQNTYKINSSEKMIVELS